MFVTERRNRILELLYKDKKISIRKLQTNLDVSACTIRNDLRKLEENGLIQRTHGGAVMPNFIQQDLSISFRKNKNAEEKSAICKEAAALVREGHCIFLDGSSTAFILAKHLKNKERITVITNGLYTALELKENPNINVILTGGVMCPKSASMEGLLGKDLITQINADIAFVSAKGFSLKEGLTDFNVYESELKKLMLSRVKKIVALVDYSKLDNISTASFVKPEQIDILITDANIPPQLLQEYKNAGLNMKVAQIPTDKT